MTAPSKTAMRSSTCSNERWKKGGSDKRARRLLLQIISVCAAERVRHDSCRRGHHECSSPVIPPPQTIEVACHHSFGSRSAAATLKGGCTSPPSLQQLQGQTAAAGAEGEGDRGAVSKADTRAERGELTKRLPSGSHCTLHAASVALNGAKDAELLQLHSGAARGNSSSSSSYHESAHRAPIALRPSAAPVSYTHLTLPTT